MRGAIIVVADDDATCRGGAVEGRDKVELCLELLLIKAHYDTSTAITIDAHTQCWQVDCSSSYSPTSSYICYCYYCYYQVSSEPTITTGDTSSASFTTSNRHQVEVLTKVSTIDGKAQAIASTAESGSNLMVASCRGKVATVTKA